ncbi:hypothetical protein [Paludibaculum fermentans]|uniref:DUF805 domain-containing protein n=1 Tax=Paludibaculum fermentans TaxID=1473598 RepID=A0A7S7NNE6_PALFE|nr:hypothetical protein [Paludibaculum fermentans]QOY86764.1 hypothetical protein IRI77_28865 [Paludibaculum fermentans]
MSPASSRVNRWSHAWRWFSDDRGSFSYFGACCGFLLLSQLATNALRPLLQIRLQGGSPPFLRFFGLWLCLAILVAAEVRNSRRRLIDLGCGAWYLYLGIGVLAAGLEAALVLRESSLRACFLIYLVVQLPLILGRAAGRPAGAGGES